MEIVVGEAKNITKEKRKEEKFCEMDCYEIL